MKPWIFLALGAFILIGLWFAFRPAPELVPAAMPAAVVPPAQRPVQLVEIGVREGRRVSGPPVVQVHAGDRVELRITSDHADELHLHGYDLKLALAPGQPASLNFQATQTGRYEYELHHAHTELGAVEVLP